MDGTALTWRHVLQLQSALGQQLEFLDIKRTPCFNRFVVELVKVHWSHTVPMDLSTPSNDFFFRNAWQRLDLSSFQNMVTSPEHLLYAREKWWEIFATFHILLKKKKVEEEEEGEEEEDLSNEESKVWCLLSLLYRSLPGNISNVKRKADVALVHIGARAALSPSVDDAIAHQIFTNNDDRRIDWRQGMVEETQL
jgi:hypothetical protein